MFNVVVIPIKRTYKKLPKEEREEIKRKGYKKIGEGYFFRMPSVGKGKLRISDNIIHCRFNKSQRIYPNKFWFNINPDSLDADYELLICGDDTVYYLIPTNLLKEMFKHPTKYPDRYHEGKVSVIDIDTSNNTIMYARTKVSINISEYKNIKIP